MPWFKIDDSSYSHPKFRRAGNAALGLWVRCGAYSAQHLLEGHVPGDIAKDFGTPPQAQKLVSAGLWHKAGHDCPRCPQPAADGYFIHDFFEGGRNSTRAQVEASRQAAAERQAKSRANAAAGSGKTKALSNRTPNGVRNEVQMGSETDPKRARNDTHFDDSAAGQSYLSQRDAMEGVTPSHAMPHHTGVLPNGSTPTSNAASRPGSYDTLGDLKQAIAAAGISGCAWNLQASQIERARQARDHVGVAAMVTYAVNSAQRLGVPTSAAAWIDGWCSLEAAPHGVTPLRAVSGGYTPWTNPADQNDYDGDL